MELKPNPVQAKIRIAEAFANTVEQHPVPEVNGVSSALEVAPSPGADGPTVHISWLLESKTIVLAFRASSKVQGLGAPELEQTITPFYITGPPRNWTTRASVSKPVVEEFKTVHEPVQAAMMNLSGYINSAGQRYPHIRHIVLTGCKAGGALAAVAAPWAKLLTPSADVRLISFDAWGSGDDEFVKLFGWLAYGYNATSTGQQGGGALKVPVTPVAYPGTGGQAAPWTDVELAALMAHVPVGTGSNAAFLHVTETPTLRDDQGTVHVVQPNDVDCVLGHLKEIRSHTAEQRVQNTGMPWTEEGMAEMNAIQKQLGLPVTDWTSEKYWEDKIGRTLRALNQLPNPLDRAVHEISSFLSLPFRWLTRSHQRPSVVDFDAVKLPDGSDKSLEDYRKGLAVAYLLPAALLADAAYCDQKDFRRLTCIKKAELIEVDIVNAQCYVAFKEGTALLVFRGSDSIQDWWLDFSFLPVPVAAVQPSLKASGVSAHLGFLIQLESLLKQRDTKKNIKLMLDKLTNGAKVDRVVVVGHSLGGALATLDGWWAALQYPEADVRVFSLASPKVGNDLFVSNIEKLAGTRMRARNNRDIVTFLPPGLGYRPVEPHVLVHGTPDEVRWIPFSKSLPQPVQVWIDHFMSGYINALKAYPPTVEFERAEGNLAVAG